MFDGGDFFYKYPLKENQGMFKKHFIDFVFYIVLVYPEDG